MIATKHGYAMAIHGSMATDLDLLFAPWQDDAAEPEMLIESIRASIDGVVQDRNEGQPETKPHGRMAWSIYLDEESANNQGTGPYIDVSVMPKAEHRLRPCYLTDQERMLFARVLNRVGVGDCEDVMGEILLYLGMSETPESLKRQFESK